ncbi:unnamed protein product [Rotaria sordida]|uniref:Peptidase S1 domain-containing protein n=1 Tax=Rotaria sordida TaxID=392033 RepID=A0A815PE66_9BILA|nr:unnamed protein product [Rotaria sordida]CAF1447655.1 unnamed protein product [Rotaria sordida]
METIVDSIHSATYRCDPSISCGCSSLSTIVTSRIVGGEAAPNNAWGWIVSLQKSGQHICGASLLTPEYAVTAAHCVDEVMNNISVLSILAGTNDLYNSSIRTIQQRSIINVTMHPDYDKLNILNDIAIIKFSPLITSSNSKLAFICLPKQDEDPFKTNSSLVAIGWGYLLEATQIVSNTLQQVTVQVFSSTSFECQQAAILDSSTQFCAGIRAGGKDTCQGDSGGPLMAFLNKRWIFAGITSNGEGCARAGYPGIYTKVSAFISFINSNVDFPVTEIRRVTLPPSIIEHNDNRSNIIKNNGNMINKSIMIMMHCFSFLTCFLFFY